MHERLIMAFIKTFLMNMCIAISFLKIKGSKKLNKRNVFILIFVNIIIGMLYSIIHENANIQLHHIFTNLICYILFMFITSMLLDEMDRNFISVLLISICFSFASFFVASAILYLITSIQVFKFIINTAIEYFLIGIIQLTIIFNFFKIKRFKDGFTFIKEDKSYKNTNRISIILSIIILSFFMFFFSKSHLTYNLTFFAMVFGMLFIMLFIQRSITNHYKSKMKDRTVEYLNEQLQEKYKIIENLKTDLDKTLKINHKYNHRILAMERAIVKAKFNEEFAEENNEIINLVKELAKDYKNETFEAESKLPKTNVFSIDNILEYMANKAKNDNIEFQVDVKCNIKDLITNIVNQSKLTTLLADHINDAIIAINYSENELRKILVVFDKIDDIYEIKIYDTGIEFEIETLLKLGKEQVTTHKDSGGTGIGFMTTFETLKESKGSLIIEENNSENYSKAIIIKFDNKCEYKIRSYRADEIREQNKNSNIIIEKI